MTTLDRFLALADDQPREFAGPELLPARMARATVAVLDDVDGAGLSVVADAVRIPIGASDADAAAAERLQFTFGAGPSLEAAASGATRFAGRERFRTIWPVLYQEMTARTPYRAVVSLPLRSYFDGFGTLDLYLRDDRGLTAQAWNAAHALAAEIAAALTAGSPPGDADAGSAPAIDPPWLNGPSAERRQRVWIAIGMIRAHLQLPAPDALDELRALAFGRDQDLDDYADDLTHRRIPLPEP